MYAVVTTGGKQYRVEAGSELVIERLTAEAGASITFDRVLLVGDGETVTVGTPTIVGASVSGTVLREELGPKLIIFKFKQKAKYRRKNGHRQHLTRVRIDEISAGGEHTKAEKAEKAEMAHAGDAPAGAEKIDAAGSARVTEKQARPRKAAATADADAPAKVARAKPAAAKPAAAKPAAAKPATRRRAPAAKPKAKE